MRHLDIKNKYLSGNGKNVFDESLFDIGEQLQYEWENDIHAIKLAIKYLRDVQGSPNYPYGVDIVLKLLTDRISEFSCPNLMKEGESCPLNNNCKYPKCFTQAYFKDIE